MAAFSKSMSLFLKDKKQNVEMHRSLSGALVEAVGGEQVFIDKHKAVTNGEASEDCFTLNSNNDILLLYINNKEYFIDLLVEVADQHGFNSVVNYVSYALSYWLKKSEWLPKHDDIEKVLFEPFLDIHGQIMGVKDGRVNIIPLAYSAAIRALLQNYDEYLSRSIYSAKTECVLNSPSGELTREMMEAVILHIGGEEELNRLIEYRTTKNTNHKYGLLYDEDDAAIFYNDHTELCKDFYAASGFNGDVKGSAAATLLSVAVYNTFINHCTSDLS